MASRNVLFGALVLAVLLALGWTGTQAQVNKDPISDDELELVGRRATVFLASIGKGQLDDELSSLLERSPLLKDSRKVQQLEDALRTELRRYGAFREVEKVRLERRSDSLIRGVYLYKCQDFPLVWEFTFYRPSPEEGWVVIALRFHIDYEKL